MAFKIPDQFIDRLPGFELLLRDGAQVGNGRVDAAEPKEREELG